MTMAVAGRLFLFLFGATALRLLGLQPLVCLSGLLLYLLCESALNRVTMLLFGRVEFPRRSAKSFAKLLELRLSCLDGFGHTL
jgi:hypothetical protein